MNFFARHLKLIRTFLPRFASRLFPRRCVLCEGSSQQDYDLCDACETELPWLDLTSCCTVCANPLPHHANTRLCARCIKTLPPYEFTFTLWQYIFPCNYFIMQLKFHHQLIYARMLGKILARHIAAYYAAHEKPLPELIIPVPLHATRLRERGFNQALEIAKTVSHILSIPLDRTHCIRHQATTPQTALSAKKRRKNLNNAFSLAKPFATTYSHIAILDDVVTTGQTAADMARMLKKSGVVQIDLWCCARTSNTRV